MVVDLVDQFRVPFEVAGKKLTAKQAESLIRKGKTPTIKGFDDGQGGKKDAKLVLNSEFVIVFG